MSEIVKGLKPYFEKTAEPIVIKLSELKVHPNVLTLLGLIFTLVGSYFLYLSYHLSAFLFILIGAITDALDGALARRSNNTTPFGAFLDSVVDRFSDAMPFVALSMRWDGVLSLLSILAIIFSYGVSYTRARAEGLGFDLRVGLFERPERLMVLLTSILLGYPELGVIVVLIGSFITTLQRVYTFSKLTKRR